MVAKTKFTDEDVNKIQALSDRVWKEKLAETIKWSALEEKFKSFSAATQEANNQQAPDLTVQQNQVKQDTEINKPNVAQEIEIKPNNQIQTQNKVEEIKQPTQEVIKDTKPLELPWSIEEWKKQGSNIADLEWIIENKYGTVATNENGQIKASIDGVEYTWVIDNAWNPIKTKTGGENALDLYSRLKAWENFPDTWIKTTKEYSKAKAGLDVYSKYNWMTEDQLYNSYINWEIWPQLEKELIDNPNLAIAKEKYNQKLITDDINNDSINMLNSYKKGNWDTIKKEEEVSFLEKLSNQITQSFTNQEKDIVSFKGFMAENYPDLVSDTKNLNSKNLELKGLVDVRDSRVEDIIRQNPWISLNRATMLAARQNKDINAQIKSMSYEIDNLQSNINYQTQIADKEFDYELQNKSQRDQIAEEKRNQAFNILKTEEQRQYEAANQGVDTEVITDAATGQKALINSATWEVIKSFDTWLKGWDTTPETKNIWTSDNPNWVSYNSDTKQFEPISVKWASTDSNGNVDYSSLDWSGNTDLISKYEWEASFKNNNPTWMTFWVSNNLKSLFKDAWINFTRGTDRPTAEGWNYIKFDNVQDWLDAYSIALTQAGSQDIYSRLKTWVGTSEWDSYATWLMEQAGITKWTKFSELNDEQLGSLMSAQLKKESPNFYNELSNLPEEKEAIVDNVANFNYANTLTASDRTKFLKQRGIEEDYIAYKANNATSSADFSDIEDITDVSFPEKITDFKSKSFGFWNRMDTSTDIISNMEDKYADSWSLTEYLSPRGEGILSAPNFLKTADRKQFEQAQRNFVNAVLRQESGAAIADSEFASAAKQYFPAPWDDIGTMDQKRANREQVIQNMYRSSWVDNKGRNIVDIYKSLKGNVQEWGDNQSDTSTWSVKDLIWTYFNNEEEESTWAWQTDPNTFITY